MPRLIHITKKALKPDVNRCSNELVEPTLCATSAYGNLALFSATNSFVSIEHNALLLLLLMIHNLKSAHMNFSHFDYVVYAIR